MIEVIVCSLPQLAKIEWVCYMTAYHRAKQWRYIQVNYVSNWTGRIIKKYLPPTELKKIFLAINKPTTVCENK